MTEFAKKVLFRGNLVDGFDVPIIGSDEKWTTYELEDETKIKVKHVLESATRVKDQYEEDGCPKFVTKGQTVVVVTPNNASLAKK